MKKEVRLITCIGSSMAVGAFSAGVIYNAEFATQGFFFILALISMGLMLGTAMTLLKDNE